MDQTRQETEQNARQVASCVRDIIRRYGCDDADGGALWLDVVSGDADGVVDGAGELLRRYIALTDETVTSLVRGAAAQQVVEVVSREACVRALAALWRIGADANRPLLVPMQDGDTVEELPLCAVLRLNNGPLAREPQLLGADATPLLAPGVLRPLVAAGCYKGLQNLATLLDPAALRFTARYALYWPFDNRRTAVSRLLLTLRTLIDVLGLDPNARPDGAPPLLHVAVRRRARCIAVLLQGGANPCAHDAAGLTALACYRQRMMTRRPAGFHDRVTDMLEAAEQAWSAWAVAMLGKPHRDAATRPHVVPADFPEELWRMVAHHVRR